MRRGKIGTTKLTKGELYRNKLIINFYRQINEVIVISDDLRHKIVAAYNGTVDDMSLLCKKKKYSNISTADCYKRYYEIKYQLELVNIFSHTFLNMIYSSFYNLIDSYHPRHNE